MPSVTTPTLSGAEPRHLATLVAVSETHSFKAAGDRLGYVQSAVSQQIAQLERALGTRVVRRVPGQAAVDLTDVGTILARHAEGILAQLDAAAGDLRTLQRAGRRLRVGVHDHAVMPCVTRALELMATNAPDVRVDVRDGQAPATQRHAAVRRGTLDAAFDDLPLADGPFEHVEVIRDPIVLVVHRDAPLAADATLPSLEALADVPLLADRDATWLAVVESQLRAAGVQPRFVLEARMNSGLQALVAARLGAALLPRLAVDERDPSTVTVELGALVAPRRIGLYWHAQRRRLDGLGAFRAAVTTALDEPAWRAGTPS